MDKVFVSDLFDKQHFQSLFMAKEKSIHVGKNGKSYLSLYLTDRTGTIDARAWDNVEDLDRQFESGDIIRVKGAVQTFQNRRQVIVHKLEKVHDVPIAMEEFICRSEKDPEDLLRALFVIVETIRDPNVRQITLDTLNDTSIRPLLLKSPAAKSIHHAKVGGLLEHVLSICGLMNFLAQHYPQLNRDLLIFGAIFHDIGKVWELEINHGVTYTDAGRLIGHLVMAVELIERKANRILGFPETLKLVLKHIVLSHHGRLEYGSPKRPKILEAVVVSMVDDLDSKIDTITTLLNAEREHAERWTKYTGLFDRYFFLQAHEGLETGESGSQVDEQRSASGSYDGEHEGSI